MGSIIQHWSDGDIGLKTNLYVVFFPGDVAVLHRGTPLYGQPAWWGDGDTDDQQPGRPEEKSSDRKREKAEAGINNAVKTAVL